MPKGALLESSSNFLKNDFWIKRLEGGDFSWVLIISLSKLFEEHKNKNMNNDKGFISKLC